VRESGRPVLIPGEVEVRISTLLSRRRVSGTLAQRMPSIVPADPSSRPHPAAHGADDQPVRPGQKGARGRQHHRDVAPHSVGGPGAHVPSIVLFLRALWEADGCIGILQGYMQAAEGCRQVAEGCKWEWERCTWNGCVFTCSATAYTHPLHVHLSADACVHVVQLCKVAQG